MNSKAYKYLIPNVILVVISILIGIFLPKTLVENATISLLTSIWMLLAALTYDVLNLPSVYQNDKNFFEQISKPDGFKTLVERVAKQVDEIWIERHENFGFIYQQSITELEDCNIRIATMHDHGVMKLEGDSPLEKTTECFKKVGKTVFAISFANEDTKHVWQSDRMKLYLDANREAVERGVDVTRVFIFDSIEQMLDRDFQMDVLRKQLDIKVTERKRLKVYVIFRPQIQLSNIPDFSLYDDRVVSTWESLRLDKIDRSRLECNEQARKNAKSVRDHILFPGRAKFLNSIDEIESIARTWRN